jgi:hypothetical protein
MGLYETLLYTNRILVEIVMMLILPALLAGIPIGLKLANYWGYTKLEVPLVLVVVPVIYWVVVFIVLSVQWKLLNIQSSFL